MTIYVKKSRQKSGKVTEWLWVNFTHQKDGKRYRKPLNLKNTPANRKLAESKLLPQLQLRVLDGSFFNNTVPTFNEFSTKSFAMHSESRKATTQADYKSAYEMHIKPVIGEKRLDTLKPSDIQTWQNALLKKLSPRRVRNIRAVLSGILQDAMRDEIITKNPLSLVSVPKIKKAEIFPFSVGEIFQILDKAEGQFKNLFALGFFTGMRSGEMIGLKWSDMDFNRKEINISRAIKMGVISTPKTVGSIRTIDIIDSLLPYLKEQYENTGNKDSYVFLNDEGTHFYDIKRVRNTHWKRVLESCGLKYRPIYHVRHSFATMMLENNEDILWVSSMLGHSDASVTLSHYAKYVNRKEKKRGQFLAKSLASNVTSMSLCDLESA